MRVRPVSRFAVPGSTVFFEVEVETGTLLTARACDEGAGYDVGVAPAGSDDGSYRVRVDVPRAAGMA